MSVSKLLKHPSAWIPPVMSLSALGMVLVHVLVSGVAREPDEGTVAHVWQLLMVAQVPVIAWFAVKWLSQEPKQAAGVLALQVGGVMAAIAAVLFLGL